MRQLKRIMVEVTPEQMYGHPDLALRIRVVTGDDQYNVERHFHPDSFYSIFDRVFDTAKQQIKEAMDNQQL